ncbi:MAG: prepilin-type N-terminal cleavage/methylation domain-containing protein [Cyanobacteria bacterium]|jgi:prepilin-type N-terminal cleavage/methylation domain-containing protein|nr:prepilin-type N-terminal cleavage/methylation domain-containing protein [Cyanobacteria bacterium GSL.Bin21]
MFSLQTFLRGRFKQSQGFTLIELLVVIIIVGVLGVTALPNFVKQVGKARETEAKNFLGTITYAQQAYHFEKQVFAPQVNQLGVTINPEYYNYPDPTTSDSTKVLHQAVAINAASDQVKNYAAGVYFGSGNYSTTICQGNDIGTAATAGTSAGNCADGKVIK